MQSHAQIPCSGLAHFPAASVRLESKSICFGEEAVRCHRALPCSLTFSKYSSARLIRSTTSGAVHELHASNQTQQDWLQSLHMSPISERIDIRSLCESDIIRSVARRRQSYMLHFLELPPESLNAIRVEKLEHPAKCGDAAVLDNHNPFLRLLHPALAKEGFEVIPSINERHESGRKRG